MMFNSTTNKQTVCLAANDIASIFKDLRQAFSEQGYNVTSFVNDIPPKNGIIDGDNYQYWKSKYDPFFFKLLDNRLWVQKAPWFINKYLHQFRNWYRSLAVRIQFQIILKKTDLFVFICDSFNYDLNFLKLIKDRQKKIVYIFVGDDARWYYGMKQEFELLGIEPIPYDDDYDYSVKGLEMRLQKIRYVEKFADLIYSKREQAQLQIREFMHYPMIVDTKKLLPSFEQRNKRPIVVHAPSNKIGKGSNIIIEAVERLKKEGFDFEFKLISGVKHSVAMKEYHNADIIIDQIYTPGAGKLSSEAMAMGKVVLSRMAYDRYDQGFPISDCPIVDIAPHTIYDQLKRIILDYELRKDLSVKSRIYAEKYLDVRHFVKSIILFFKAGQMRYSYKPDFFQKNYEPESESALACVNKWSNFIQNEKFCEGIDLIKYSGKSEVKV